MLQLRDAKLELFPLLARHEPELACDVLDAPFRPLPHADRVAAPPGAEVVEERADLVEPRPEQLDQPFEIGGATGRAHAAVTCGVDGGARAWQQRRRRSRR